MFIATLFAGAGLLAAPSTASAAPAAESVVSVAAAPAAAVKAAAIVKKGTDKQFKGPHSKAYGQQTWDAGKETVALKSFLKGTPPKGFCHAIIFDWERNNPIPKASDHHDARGVINCKKNSSHSRSWNDKASNGLKGMQKGGTCYGPRNSETKEAHYCKASGDSDGGVTGISTKPGKCSSLSILNANGKKKFHSGGKPMSCTS